MSQQTQVFQWYFLLPSLISGILAFLGSYIGSKTHRKTQHELWLKENRASIFKEFHQIKDECDKEAKNIETPYELLYKRLDNYRNIIQMFIYKDERKNFDNLLNSLISNKCFLVREKKKPADPNYLDHYERKISKISNEIDSIINRHIDLSK